MPKIFTEDPDDEQWQILSKFIYSSNIEAFFEARGLDNYDQKLIEIISGSILQAQEYFRAASLTSLNTSPLLLYYGAVNLLTAVATLSSGETISIKNHGIKLDPQSENRLTTANNSMLAEIEFTPYFSTEHGGLFQFCKAFAFDHDVSRYASTGNWTLMEILGSIPELKLDFEACYKSKSYVIPLQTVINQSDYIERIELKEFDGLDPLEELSKVDNFSKSYIVPNTRPNYFNYQYVFLRNKISGLNISEISVFGQKFLRKTHVKGAHRITLPTIIYMYMGLFVSSYLSRYRPGIWSPFVKSDSTGERQIIEKFIKTCRRSLPNLVINFLYQERFYFVKEMHEPLNLSREVSEDKIRKMITEEIERYRQ